MTCQKFRVMLKRLFKKKKKKARANSLFKKCTQVTLFQYSKKYIETLVLMAWQ